MAGSFMDYLVINGLLYDLQSAFRVEHSTESALIKLTDQILFDLDQDKVTGMVSVDFKKAFDLVDHQLLLRKLRLYRLSDSALSWFQSYITDRHQFVTIHGERSDSLKIKQGVPQGSVLGPILFLLFVNDMPLHLSSSSADIFADDTTITVSAHYLNIQSLTDDLNKDLEVVGEWPSNNKMLINADKTKSLLVTGKRIAKKLHGDVTPCLNLKIKNSEILEVSNLKLLGLTYDRNMTIEPHIDQLCKKLSKRLGLLKHISPYLKKRQRETYYNGIIKPTMMYGSMVWDNCSSDWVQRILKLQKRAARIILDADRTTPSITLFNTLNWLPFTRQSQIKRNTLVYKRVNTSVNAPNYIDRLLLRNSDIHQRETRYSNTNLVCPRFTRKTEGGRTFTVRSSIEWNSIDMDIRKKTSVAS